MIRRGIRRARPTRVIELDGRAFGEREPRTEYRHHALLGILFEIDVSAVREVLA